MPNYWVKIDSSPPKPRRDDVRTIVKRWGGDLREDQLYKPIAQPGIAYVLVNGPADPKAAARMLEELGAKEGTMTLLDVEEAQESFDLPPRDGDPDQGREDDIQPVA